MGTLIITTLVIISLLFSGGMIIYLNSQLKKSDENIRSLRKENGLVKKKLEFYIRDRAFRLTLDKPIECQFQITQLDKQHIEIDKKAIGYIVDISRTGMLLETDFDCQLKKVIFY